MENSELNNDNEKELVRIHFPGEILYRNTLFCDLVSFDILKAIENLEFRSNDIIVATYPKSGMCHELEQIEINFLFYLLIIIYKTGTHWVSEIISLLLNAENPDNLALKEKNFYKRFKFLEIKSITGEINYKLLNETPKTQQRLIFTHLKPSFLSFSIWQNRPKVS